MFYPLVFEIPVTVYPMKLRPFFWRGFLTMWYSAAWNFLLLPPPPNPSHLIIWWNLFLFQGRCLPNLSRRTGPLCSFLPWDVICSHHCCALLVHCGTFKACFPDSLRFFINAGIALFIPVMLWHRVDFLADFTFSTRSFHCPNFKVICISSLLY